MLSEGKTLLVCGTKPTPISTSWLVRRLVMSRSPSVTDARVHLHQAEHRLQQRRLAGAVRADDADHLARVGDQAAAVEDVDAGQVARDHVLGLDDGLLGGCRGRDPALLLLGHLQSLRLFLGLAFGVLGGHLFGDLLERLVGQQRVVTEVGVVVRTEVGVDHGRVGHHGVGRALGDQPALGHHRDPVGDVAYDVHVVLDEQHGHALVAQRTGCGRAATASAPGSRRPSARRA